MENHLKSKKKDIIDIYIEDKSTIAPFGLRYHATIRFLDDLKGLYRREYTVEGVVKCLFLVGLMLSCSMKSFMLLLWLKGSAL